MEQRVENHVPEQSEQANNIFNNIYRFYNRTERVVGFGFRF